MTSPLRRWWQQFTCALAGHRGIFCVDSRKSIWQCKSCEKRMVIKP